MWGQLLIPASGLKGMFLLISTVSPWIAGCYNIYLHCDSVLRPPFMDLGSVALDTVHTNKKGIWLCPEEFMV